MSKSLKKKKTSKDELNDSKSCKIQRFLRDIEEKVRKLSPEITLTLNLYTFLIISRI